MNLRLPYPSPRLLPVLLCLTLAACASWRTEPTPAPVSDACALPTTTVAGAAAALPGAAGAPEVATGYTPKNLVRADSFMAITNNPLSTKVACDILKRGGSAADAAVAAQMALNLVEPQSSGIGGGAFIMYYDAVTGRVLAYDGRETAPAAADENYLRWKSAADRTPPLPDAMRSGRSIGTPGVLRALEMLHAEHGRLPWPRLFAPAIEMAEAGFPVPQRLAASIAEPAALARIRHEPRMAAH
ncbi:MAG: gamma-glutamyltransferase, partial [Burkholderiaceae bacterium]